MRGSADGQRPASALSELCNCSIWPAVTPKGAPKTLRAEEASQDGVPGPSFIATPGTQTATGSKEGRCQSLVTTVPRFHDDYVDQAPLALQHCLLRTSSSPCVWAARGGICFSRLADSPLMCVVRVPASSSTRPLRDTWVTPTSWHLEWCCYERGGASYLFKPLLLVLLGSRR